MKVQIKPNKKNALVKLLILCTIIKTFYLLRCCATNTKGEIQTYFPSNHENTQKRNFETSPEDGIIENDEVTVQTAGPQHIDNFINSSLLKFPKNENSNNALPQHCILESDLPNEVELMILIQKVALITEQRKSKLV
ncbi:unnamed protein product [Rotaria socialis]|uniref:Uncharacterized protein n=1 Tax=Rotaria socialis TaxID=392032 RepID=A0A820YPN6_9BILA|nr:unnamed protein product [Rotaria socialis]CAF4550860.1 unnamed protein product [Rotaria socialis]